MALSRFYRLLAVFAAFVLAAGCVRPTKDYEPFQLPASENDKGSTPTANPTLLSFLPPTRQPGEPIYTPTPDSPHAVPTPRSSQDEYAVQANDTLGAIAKKYNVDINSLAEANNLTDINHLDIGQILKIPAPTPSAPGPSFKIIPDSELVYSPTCAYFDLFAFISAANGYLANYKETLDDVEYNGAQVVARIAREFSVNPRILLAVLEYQSGWVTQAHPAEETLDYPIRYFDPNRKGLYRQLALAANNLNRGYYLYKINALASMILTDGSIVPPSPEINPGTAGVQYLASLLYDHASWDQAVSVQGIFAVFNRLFGYPFDYTFEPLLPADLTQPKLNLPFEQGVTWYFTGGPHGGWGDGSAWAAIDFAPPGEQLGCYTSDAWVTAAADGLIIRAQDGEVVQDLDGDGIEQTGWTLLYMHIESRDRVAVGTYLNAGDRIGHPSCEGGVSNGTHFHLARRYNGEWIPADGNLPFDLEGWISIGTGKEYDGILTREGQVIEAWDSRKPENQISR